MIEPLSQDEFLVTNAAMCAYFGTYLFILSWVTDSNPTVRSLLV